MVYYGTNKDGVFLMLTKLVQALKGKTHLSSKDLPRHYFSVNKTVSGGSDVTEEARVMASTTAQADMSSIRTETWQGKEWTVVPVVAVVEGVLFGANAAAPEFAPASEFGKFPSAWNGRPVMMNHPQIDGVFVSASIPEVLDAYQIGTMFQTKLEDNKLKTEAWLDNARIAELGGVFQETLDRILNGDIVEVSVGAYIETIQKSGVFNGKSYSGVWSNVAPDHLAFLEEGQVGACSVKDGCGTPRLNMGKPEQGMTVYSSNPEAVKIGGNSTPCCNGCAAGTGCEEHSHDDPNKDDLTAEQQQERRAELLAHIFGEVTIGEDGGLNVNAIASDVTIDDARRVIFQALQELTNVPSYDLDIMAMTTDVVVYYVWGTNRDFKQISYSVASDGAVTFSGEPTSVNLMTRILPRQTGTGLSNNERNEGMSGQTGQEGAVPETPAVAAPVQVKSFSELLAEAPKEVQDQFNYGMQAYNARKSELIAGLKALQHNPYSDEQLNAMDVAGLENLSKLANVASFAGRAQPGGEENMTVNGGNQQQATKFATAPTNFLGQSQEA